MATLAAQFNAALGNIEPEDDASNAADAHKHVHDLAMLVQCAIQGTTDQR
jgi:hypothetical protein